MLLEIFFTQIFLSNCVGLTNDNIILSSLVQLSFHLCMVLVYDVLFGKGVQCGGKIKQAIHRHKTELKSVLSELDLAQYIPNRGGN